MPWVAAGLAAASLAQGMMANSSAQSAQRDAMGMQAGLANAQLDLAGRQLNAQLATQTDANGNQVVYDPKTNQWKTILSPISQALLDASNREQLQQLTHDASQRRQTMDANFGRQQQEGSMADALARQYQYQQQNPRNHIAEMSGLIGLAQDHGIADAYRQQGETMATQALRSGAGGAADALTRSSIQEGKDLAAANVQAMLQGRTLGQQQGAAATGDLLNQYNLMANRAGAVPGFAPNATNIPGSMSAALTNSMGAASRGAAMAGQLTGSASNMLTNGMSPLMQANMGNAQGTAAFGQLLQGLMSKYGENGISNADFYKSTGLHNGTSEGAF